MLSNFSKPLNFYIYDNLQIYVVLCDTKHHVIRRHNTTTCLVTQELSRESRCRIKLILGMTRYLNLNFCVYCIESRRRHVSENSHRTFKSQLYVFAVRSLKHTTFLLAHYLKWNTNMSSCFPAILHVSWCCVCVCEWCSVCVELCSV